MASKKLWYCVSKSGQGRVFTSLPVRNEHWGIFEGDSIGFISSLFMLMEADEGLKVPDISWADEPVEMELNLTFV